MNHIQATFSTQLSAAQRAYEITLILAAAIIRTQQAHKATEHHFPLGFLPGKSVHTNLYQQSRSI
jgi:hypothetical protein